MDTWLAEAWTGLQAWLSDTPGDVLRHLLTAMLAGGFIGLERSYHGRAAGFRTHVLVCTASSLLMLLTVYQDEWYRGGADARVDPTRMAQGVMTGIGFLGAGVIVKDGFTVRGLTTAASIWMTAAIGILAGAGFESAVVLATGLTFGTLAIFRVIENTMPVQRFAQHSVRFHRDAVLDEASLRALIVRHGFTIANMSYRQVGEGRNFEYRMSLRTGRERNAGNLARELAAREDVVEFKIAPTAD